MTRDSERSFRAHFMADWRFAATRIMRGCTVTWLTAMSIGCVHTMSTTVVADAPPPGYTAPTRTSQECASLMASVRAEVETAKDAKTSSATRQRPMPRSITFPDESKRPADIVGKTATVEVRVNERGETEAASVRIVGIGESAYAAQLRKLARTFLFWPAVRDGCAVPAWASVDFAPAGH